MHRPARRNGSPQHVASLLYRLMVPAAPCLELRRTCKKRQGLPIRNNTKWHARAGGLPDITIYFMVIDGDDRTLARNAYGRTARERHGHMKQSARGEGDVLLTHPPETEKVWMVGGNGTSRRLVMYDDFVIIVPEADSTKI